MKATSFVNLHRHGEFSRFDGYGKAQQAAEYAKELGQTALSLTDHGTVSGMIGHYFACKEVGIKPILGVEAYFQPKFNTEKKPYHLCMYAMNDVGYVNFNKILTEASDKNYYRTGVVTFELLEKYNEGVIVSSACIIGALSRMILEEKRELAVKIAKKFKQIFGDRYYIEIMPYTIDNMGDAQERVNEALLDIADELDIEVIATCDSHYIKQSDFDTYMIMHKIAKHKDIADYSERYMPSGEEVYQRVLEMHGKRAVRAVSNTQRLADRCDVKLEFAESVPSFDWGMDSKDKLKELIKEGYKRKVSMRKASGKGITKDENAKYVDRIKQEYTTIVDDLGLEDYFLLCYDIIKYAKDNDVPIGPGRGSVCGSLVANLIGITEVDPLVLGTDFERFLRPDKKKLPDIDMDFGQAERERVLAYVMQRHAGRAAQIATFGYYRCKNLANDLAKAMEVEDSDKIAFKLKLDKIVGDAKDISFTVLMKDVVLRNLNKKYTNIVKHFCNLYGQVRFTGKHAAGVAITVGPIDERIALMKSGGKMVTSYDLGDLSKINVLKMDILGLSTASILHEACRTSGYTIDWSETDDEEIFKAFRNGETEGIFQFEKGTAKDILARIECENIQDLIAANALNRPAPLQLGVLDDFIDGKLNHTTNKSQPWYKYTKETYGTIIFQEHVMRICRHIAKMDWPDVDKVMKSLRQPGEDGEDPLMEKFIAGAVKYSGFKRRDAEQLYKRVTLYSFNKGHCSAYSLISYKAMELRIRKPIDFWCATLKFEQDEQKREAYKCCAVHDGCVVMLPHVNGTASDTIRELDGDKVIQEGMYSIKGIGLKAAQTIERNAPYIDYPDFEEKWKALPPIERRSITKKTVEALREAGALEFRRRFYLKRVVAYNSSLLGKHIKVW